MNTLAAKKNIYNVYIYIYKYLDLTNLKLFTKFDSEFQVQK